MRTISFISRGGAALLSAVLLSACYNPKYSSDSDAGMAFHCFNTDNPVCPAGLVCCVGEVCGDQLASNQEGWCVPPPVPHDMTITGLDYWDFPTKTMYYGGPVMDPNLSGMDPDTGKWRCHRDDTNPATTDTEVLRQHEPNDLPGNATYLSSPLPADPGPTYMGSAYEICADHANPNAADVDAFRFKLSSPAKVIIEVKYPVKFGDLDVALFLMGKNPDTGADQPQRVLADLSATDNGCIEANNLMPGVYFVVVRGSTTPEKPGIYTMNNYTLRVYTTTMGASCAKKDGGA